jgi:PrtD family type I secretion system ABC transporter
VAAVFGLAFANQFATRGALRETSAAHMRAMRRIEATGRNAEVVTAMGMLPNLAQAWAREHRQASKQSERAAASASLFTALTRFTRLMLQLGCLALGAWLVTRHEASIGAMMAAALVFNRALAPVEQMMGGWRQFALARSAYDRLRRFFGETPPPADGMPLPEPKGRLQVERVSFAIPGTDRLVIKGVSFDLEPGEALAIVGPSGAGKSTLARLMVGLDRPTVGHVRLDAADVWLWDRQDLGRWIGFVPQDVELFAGTIAENIARMGKPDPFEVTRAAKLAGVHEMILRTPKGYDTDIGESGSMLSAGQRQRVALARAVYGGPRYFVFDEPNSNLDQEGEEALVRTIQKLKENGAAIILITHRPSLVSCVDKMVVLRDGVVMMQGTRSEVLERLGRRDQQQRIAAGRNAEAMPPLQAPRTAAAAASATPAATPSTPQRPLPNPPNRLRPMKVGTSNQTLEGSE